MRRCFLIVSNVTAEAQDPCHVAAHWKIGRYYPGSPNSFAALQTLPTMRDARCAVRGARTIVLDESTGTIYTVTGDFGLRPAATAEHPILVPAWHLAALLSW